MPTGLAITVVDALVAARGPDAAALVFEYMAATQAETGHPVPASIDDLPAALRRECQDLPAVYGPPGALLLADLGGRAAGCVGLAPCPGEGAGVAEVRRLYVRPDCRASGIARELMSHVHACAAERGMTRLILDVLPARTGVVAFYQRLGYVQRQPPWPARSRGPMIYLERPVTPREPVDRDVRA